MRVRDMLTETVERRRQDLNYLKTVVGGADRYYLPALREREVGERVVKDELRSLGAPSPVDPSPDMDLSFLEQAKGVPVSGLMYEGIPLHPAGVHQEKGLTTTNRVFGGSKWDQEWLRRMLLFETPQGIESSLRKYVYSRGTASGFATRLRGLATRNPPQITASLGLSDEAVLARLRYLFPMKDSTWPTNWHADLSEQFEAIKTSKNASAGAPYWRDKREAAGVCMDVVLPLIHKALAEGKVAELCKTQPELFLGEVKNKLDRYEPDKVAQKTRPYFALPFHWQALFSMMSQPFTEMLEQFDSGNGVNAYGFSHAHGGAARLLEWAKQAEDLEKGGMPRFACYGDDVDLYWRSKGVLYRVTPDFRQMDASVDKTTIKIAIVYIVEVLTKAWGENPYFEQVAKWWLRFATNPWFLVHGPNLYRKKTADGLMTGVVGTTFFDTVKSALAYDEWATQVGTFKERKLLEEVHAVKWFRDKFGLDVKVGTWRPTPVLEHPTPGQEVTPLKFLGMKLQYRQGPNRVEPVPFLDTDDWLDLLLSPRDDPAVRKKSGGGSNSLSFLQRSRTWFDRCRGYMATGAAFDEHTRLLLGSIANTIDPVAVVMSVQANGGTGEAPELAGPVSTEKWEWPDSSGFPTLRWCENLYFSPDNQWDDPPEELWRDLYPTVSPILQGFKRDHLVPKMSVLEVWRGKPETKTDPPLRAVQELKLVEETFEGEEKEVERMDPISAPKEKVLLPVKKAVERAPILNYAPGKNVEPAKRIPTFAETLMSMFATRQCPVVYPRPTKAGRRTSPEYQSLSEWVKERGLDPSRIHTTPVFPVRRIAESFGRSEESVEKEARKCGLYVIGRPSMRLLTKVQLETSNPGVARQFEKQKAVNLEKASVIGPSTSKVVQVLTHTARAEGAPLSVTRLGHDPQFVKKGVRKGGDPMSTLNSILQVNGYVPILANRNKQEGKIQRTATRLYLKNLDGDKEHKHPWLEAVGESSRKNYATLLEYAIRIGAEAEEYEPDWAKAVEAEERARFESPMGLEFVVKDRFIAPGPDFDHNKWTLEKGFLMLGGVLWKQRKTETLRAFCERTAKALDRCGRKVDWIAPKSIDPE
nr:MAG: RNA-dependent RNA polymerase [Permutotetraviridae sp.]